MVGGIIVAQWPKNSEDWKVCHSLGLANQVSREGSGLRGLVDSLGLADWVWSKVLAESSEDYG